MNQPGAQLDLQPSPPPSREAAGRWMRAGVYRGAGRVQVERVPVPEISEGEVLLRVGACGIWTRECLRTSITAFSRSRLTRQ